MDNNNLNQQNNVQLQQSQPQQVIQQPAAQQPVVYVQQPQQPQQPQQVQQYTAPPQTIVYAQQPVYVQTPPADPNKGKGLGMGIAGMVLGVSSFAYSMIMCFLFFIIMMVCVDEASYYSSYYSVIEYAAYYGYLVVFIIYGLLGTILAIPGTILSGIAKKYLKTALTKVGFVFNLISLIAMGAMFIFSLFGTIMYA